MNQDFHICTFKFFFSHANGKGLSIFLVSANDVLKALPVFGSPRL